MFILLLISSISFSKFYLSVYCDLLTRPVVKGVLAFLINVFRITN